MGKMGAHGFVSSLKITGTPQDRLFADIVPWDGFFLFSLGFADSVGVSGVCDGKG